MGKGATAPEVGPAMASISLRAETARRTLDPDPDGLGAAEHIMADISADAATAAESLRAMAYELRPQRSTSSAWSGRWR